MPTSTHFWVPMIRLLINAQLVLEKKILPLRALSLREITIIICATIASSFSVI